VQGCRYGTDAPSEGWPSLHVIPFSTDMADLSVNVLGVPSRHLTRALFPEDASVPASKAPEIAEAFVGNVCFVRYAQLAPAVEIGTQLVPAGSDLTHGMPAPVINTALLLSVQMHIIIECVALWQDVVDCVCSVCIIYLTIASSMQTQTFGEQHNYFLRKCLKGGGKMSLQPMAVAMAGCCISLCARCQMC
jgi:hypothetical protein